MAIEGFGFCPSDLTDLSFVLDNRRVSSTDSVVQFGGDNNTPRALLKEQRSPPTINNMYISMVMPIFSSEDKSYTTNQLILNTNKITDVLGAVRAGPPRTIKIPAGAAKADFCCSFNPNMSNNYHRFAP